MPTPTTLEVPIADILHATLSRLTVDELDVLRDLVGILVDPEDAEEKESATAGITELLNPDPIVLVPFDLPATLEGRGPSPLAMDVGRKIRELRESGGLDQAELGARCGLTQSHVSRLESGKHCPNAKTRDRLAKALGVDPTIFDPAST